MPPGKERIAPDREVDRLYGVDPGEFVAERTATARTLRKQGRREEATAVERLRKPSVAASVVNRLARDAPGALGALLDAGRHLREVQMAAGSAQDLRAATDAGQEALRALMREAGQAATRVGSGGETTLQRVHDTLHAAALDPELADQVRRGVLVREQQAVGFPLDFSAPARPRPARRQASKGTPRPRVRTPAPGGGAATRPSRTETAAAKRLERAAAEAAAAQEKLAAADETLSTAKAALGESKRELERARRAAADAQRRVDQSQRQLERAQRAHDAARARAEAAGSRLEELPSDADDT